jgi:AMP nucleosidase
MITPDVAPRREFNDPDAALAHAASIYDAGVAHLRGQLQSFLDGHLPGDRVRATYPYVRIRVDTATRAWPTASSPARAATRPR